MPFGLLSRDRLNGGVGNASEFRPVSVAAGSGLGVTCPDSLAGSKCDSRGEHGGVTSSTTSSLLSPGDVRGSLKLGSWDGKVGQIVWIRANFDNVQLETPTTVSSTFDLRDGRLGTGVAHTVAIYRISTKVDPAYKCHVHC
jgi:hypothetical protein